MDFPSFSQLFQAARTEALIRNPQLTRDAVEREGSDANILLASAAAVGDEVVAQLIAVTAGLYLDSASGEALDRLLGDRYGLLRKTAAAAVGQVAFGLVGTNPAAFTIPAGTTLSTADQIKFETTAPVLFPAGVSLVYADVRSLLAGSAQQVRPNTITSILSPIPFAPPTLQVTNPYATAGAADRESDTAFRQRGQAFFSTARRGTLAALVQGALAVPGVQSAAAFEGLDAFGKPAPYVSLIVADAYTEALADLSTTPPSYWTQSETLAQTVTAALEEYRPAGLYVQVTVALTYLVPISLSLSYLGSVDTVAVSQSARAALVTYVNSLPPGSAVDPDALVAVLRTVPGLLVTGNEILQPAGAITLLPRAVPRTSLELVKTVAVDGVIVGTV